MEAIVVSHDSPPLAAREVFGFTRRFYTTRGARKMAKATSGNGGLDAMRGKKVAFAGKFEWGVQERLRAMAEAQQATIQKSLNSATDYLVINDLSGGKTVQKQVVALNSKGASVRVIGADDFEKLVQLTDEEIVLLIRKG